MNDLPESPVLREATVGQIALEIQKRFDRFMLIGCGTPDSKVETEFYWSHFLDGLSLSRLAQFEAARHICPLHPDMEEQKAREGETPEDHEPDDEEPPE